MVIYLKFEFESNEDLALHFMPINYKINMSEFISIDMSDNRQPYTNMERTHTYLEKILAPI